MPARHARTPEKSPRRWGLVLVALLILAVLGGGVFLLWRHVGNTPPPARETAATAASHPATTTTRTDGELPATQPEPTATQPPEPVTREFARPQQMRGVWLTDGVEYDSGKGESCKGQIDKAFEAVKNGDWNTLLVPVGENASGFDAPGYILQKAREQKLYIYFVCDMGVLREGGLDPTDPAQSRQAVERAAQLAKRWSPDGFLLTGFSYRYGDKPMDPGTAVDDMIAEAVEAIHGVNKDYYVGLLSEGVWAHSSVREGGSKTANVYEELTDGGADTRELVLSGKVDFIMVKAYRATGDHSAPFGTVLNWWADVCKQAEVPLYIAHSAQNAARHARGYTVDDQLARQVLACQKCEGWRGSAFDSLSALTGSPAVYAAMQAAFDGTLMEEYITRTLTLTSPAKQEITTNESSVSIRGSADPNFPITLNGEPVELTDHGFFTLDMPLSPGANVFTFENKGVTTTYTVHYKIIILRSVSPSDPLLMDGGAAITLSALAHKDAAVYATLGGTRIPMEPVEVQEEEGDDSGSDYVTYAGSYTLPEGLIGEERKLGAVKVTGEYRGQSESRSGGTVTVKALPEPEPDLEPEVKPVEVKNLTPIDPGAGEGEVLDTGTVMIITADYAETFNGDTTDDKSRPTNAYLPKGTTDLLKGTAYDAASDHQYYLLGCGRRVYVEDAAEYITGGSLTANTLTGGQVTVGSRATVLTFGADWRVPFQLQLLPQKYLAPQKQEYLTDKQTTEYVEITFYYSAPTAAAPDLSASPLFTRAEWRQTGSAATLRLYLTKTAAFYGYHVEWDEQGRITFSFKHPAYVGDNGPEQPLKGFKVVLDPGHGGNSIGTSGGNLAEKTAVLTYSQLIREKLTALGATVVMTRSTDTAVSLEQRTVITRAADADLFLSVHMNGIDSASVRGCTVHYFSDYSIGLAGIMYRSMLAAYTDFGAPERGGVRWSPFYVCRVSEVPALLLECGFMTNAEDLELLITPAFQDALTTRVAEAVTEYAKSLPRL